MTASALAIIGGTIVISSFISGVFGMAGGMVLLGVLLVYFDVATGMVLFSIIQTHRQRLARAALAATSCSGRSSTGTSRARSWPSR